MKHLSRLSQSTLRVGPVLVAAALLCACAPLLKPLPGSEAIPPTAYGPVNQKLKEAQAALPPAPVNLPTGQRLPAFDMSEDKGSGQPALYSFKARDLPLRDALGLLARAHGLNIVADPDITGTVTVDFQDIPLSKAFDILLSSMGYSWEEERGIIRVRASITRTFEIDYIRSGRSTATTTAGAGTAGGEAGAFWSEFESQIRSLLSPKGRLTVNRLTGSVMLSDLPSKVADASRFIELMRDGMYRQIDIEVRIVEVTLRDQFAMGLDWSRFSLNPLRGALAINTLISAPQATSRLPGTVTANFSGDRYGALIEALREQGDVRMVSQPRIRILNNQTAAVKVGTDETFFSRSTNRIIQGGGNVLDTVNEQARSVNLGVSLTVTPQISADGWAMLNIAPTVTRLVGTVTSPSGESSAPVLDVSEATTMVRVRSGELVMLGGLIQEETSDTNRRVPGLGDLPILGNAFKSTYQAGKRKELVIFLAPTVQPGQ